MRDFESYFRERLSKSISKTVVDEMADIIQNDDTAKYALYKLMFNTDSRVANNAAWVFCNVNEQGNKWLFPKHDKLIDEAIKTSDATNRRLMLVLLLRQPFDKECLRTDFLDFCLSCIASGKESTSVKTLCIKLAYEQCKFYPDLLRELQSTLELLEPDLLSTGVRTVRRKTLISICRILNQFAIE